MSAVRHLPAGRSVPYLRGFYKRAGKKLQADWCEFVSRSDKNNRRTSGRRNGSGLDTAAAAVPGRSARICPHRNYKGLFSV
jgi:hypothetical protein